MPLITAVFLPHDPESTMFDAVAAACAAVGNGCRLHVRRADNRMAFLPRKSDPDYWRARGWDLFGQATKHGETAPCAA